MRLSRIVFLGFLTACVVFAKPAAADNPSAASEVSAVGVSALGAASYELIASGGKLVLTAVSTSAEVGSVVITAAGTGISTTLQVSTEVATAVSTDIGHGIERVAVSGGWMLTSGGRSICFVPDRDARRHLHRRELSR